jgi:hypothetical protein
MSGGAWGHKEQHILDLAERGREEISQLLAAAAFTEHIVDWAVCGDTDKESAAKQLFDLWKSTFDDLYGRD